VPKKRSASGPRPRKHIIASQSRNFVERFFVYKDHLVDSPREDYGIDLVATTFDRRGYPEAGNILFQLKASDKVRYSSDGSYISFSIEVKHYRYWMKQIMPVFLIVYDAKKVVAFWVHIQAYFDVNKKPKKKAKNITIRLPARNKFGMRAVDHMRNKKNEKVTALSGV
jgi:uncharacterized protein DUF4365